MGYSNDMIGKKKAATWNQIRTCGSKLKTKKICYGRSNRPFSLARRFDLTPRSIITRDFAKLSVRKLESRVSPLEAPEILATPLADLRNWVTQGRENTIHPRPSCRGRFHPRPPRRTCGSATCATGIGTARSASLIATATWVIASVSPSSLATMGHIV